MGKSPAWNWENLKKKNKDLDSKTCPECGDYFIPHTRNQKTCLSADCLKYGSRIVNEMRYKLDKMMEKLKAELDTTVIYLDPRAYERGERVVINGPH